MKENRSLSISTLIKENMSRDLSMIFYEMFPFYLSEKHQQAKHRDRIYTQENTLLTMLLTMINEDKSLQQSVNIYSQLHDKNKEIIEMERARIIAESANESRIGKRGRRRTTGGRIAKSKLQGISLNTSAYTQARQRIGMNYIKDVFEESGKTSKASQANKWKGYRVFIADGTYLQMQDTKEICREFSSSIRGTYPRGLLETVIEQGSGIISEIKLSSERVSELELLSGIINKIPRSSLLLADDLYNCFAIFYLLKKNGIEFITPGKRVRNYEVSKKIEEGDELVYIYKTKNKSKSKWAIGKEDFDNRMLVRRIEYDDPNDKGVKRVLYTSLTDRNICKLDIILKYDSRWDIEISIREIKTLMDINIVRSKTPEMAYKEVFAALIAYNYMRRLIKEAAEDSGFFPETGVIQKFYEINKPVLVDKLGRKYARWSPGSKGYTKGANNQIFYNTI
jgi:hypothetical protein